MDRPATKDELLALISEGLADAEFAIRNHPSDTVLLYETGKSGLLAGHAKTEHTDWSRQSGFTLGELSLCASVSFGNGFYLRLASCSRRQETSEQGHGPAMSLGFRIDAMSTGGRGAHVPSIRTRMADGAETATMVVFLATRITSACS